MLRYYQPRSTSNSPSEHAAKRQRIITSAAPVSDAATGISESVLRKLQSVERHFGSQNLQSPQPEGNAPLLSPSIEADEFEFHGSQAEAGGSPDDGVFVIHCSQVYQRTQSTQQPGVSPQTASLSGDKPTSARAQSRTLSNGNTPLGPARASDVRGAGSATDRASAVPPSAAAAPAAPVPGSAAQTPELSREDEPGCSVLASQSPGRLLFPLFRPKSERKVLYLIRHGQSKFNAATISQPAFSDPKIFDARLTAQGQHQCDALRNQLSRIGHLREGALWVVSPLARALETFQLGCPYADRLRDGAAVAGAPELLISSTVAEHCATSGDVGSPASQLRSRFPLLTPFMTNLPERWWFRPDANCAAKERMGAYESMPTMRKRVGDFRCFLQSQPHKVIVCIGHCTFFREFIGGGRGTRLRNCEVHTQYL